MNASPRTLQCCPVCGFSEIFTDGVLDPVEGFAPGPLWLGACARCDHRWTAARELAPASPRIVPARRPLRREWGIEAA